MKLAALTSGGKDSILAIQKAIDEGHTVTHMVTVVPKNTESYMFHSANLHAVPVMAKRAGMQYLEIETDGEKEAEIADMERGLRVLGDRTAGDIADDHACNHIDGLVVGAIASEYQRSRVEAVARALKLTVYAPLWGMAPDAVLQEVSERMDARIVVTAADGLGENVLGKRIDASLIRVLKDIEKKRRIHIAGEGGEYESLVFNAPFFSYPLEADGMEIHMSNMVGKVTYRRFW